MSRKDFNKGMEAGASPFEEIFKKQFEDFEKGAQYINQKIDDINSVTDSIIDDLNSIEKKRLYDLNTIVDIAELGDDEKEILMAVLYTMANMTDHVTEYQQYFLRSVKNYLRVKNVQTSVDLSSIENIESINDQKAILQTIMEFLFLENADHGYMDEYEDVMEYFSVNRKGVREIQECIDRIYKATGLQGIAENYGYVVIEEAEKNDKDSTIVNESYDGSDICEACADIININQEYVTLDDYLVYYDGTSDKLYRVSKKDGKIVEINTELDIDIVWPIFSFSETMLGCGENLFLFFNSNKNVFDDEGDILTKININTFQTSKVKLIGEGRKNHQCNKYYFTYSCRLENTDRIVKIDLKNNNINVLEQIIKNPGILDCSEYYLLGKTIYFKNDGLLYKLNLDKDSLETICEIPNTAYGFLSSGNTNHYNNILYTFDRGLFNDEFGYKYIDTINSKGIRTEAIPDYINDVYAFIQYGNIFYVKLDSSMSISKYNIITGESTVILEATQCADSYTTGILKKKTHYHMTGSRPQVVGKWLYYLGRTSRNVRKVSVDAVMGESEELLIDGKPVNRFM